jgi:hypothetical protein
MGCRSISDRAKNFSSYNEIKTLSQMGGAREADSVERRYTDQDLYI